MFLIGPKSDACLREEKPDMKKWFLIATERVSSIWPKGKRTGDVDHVFSALLITKAKSGHASLNVGDWRSEW